MTTTQIVVRVRIMGHWRPSSTIWLDFAFALVIQDIITNKHYDLNKMELFFEQCFIIEGNLGCGSFGKVSAYILGAYRSPFDIHWDHYRFTEWEAEKMVSTMLSRSRGKSSRAIWTGNIYIYLEREWWVPEEPLDLTSMLFGFEVCANWKKCSNTKNCHRIRIACAFIGLGKRRNACTYRLNCAIWAWVDTPNCIMTYRKRSFGSIWPICYRHASIYTIVISYIWTSSRKTYSLRTMAFVSSAISVWLSIFSIRLGLHDEAFVFLFFVWYRFSVSVW